MKIERMNKVLNKRTDTIPPDAIYVGRPSKWGNPYKIGSKIKGAPDKPLTRLDCVVMHHDWLLMEKEGEVLLEDIRELQGKDLVCWCAPLPCHADVLLELANWKSTQQGG